MPIPPFDAHGLLPAGVHDATLDEIEARFAWNDCRRQFWRGVVRFIDEVYRPLGVALPLLIDGSFVRETHAPKDVDVVIDASALDQLEAFKLAVAVRYSRSDLREAYHVDAWVHHPMLPADITAFFQYIGIKAGAELKLPERHPKGILRVLIP